MNLSVYPDICDIWCDYHRTRRDTTHSSELGYDIRYDEDHPYDMNNYIHLYSGILVDISEYELSQNRSSTICIGFYALWLIYIPPWTDLQPMRYICIGAPHLGYSDSTTCLYYTICDAISPRYSSRIYLYLRRGDRWIWILWLRDCQPVHRYMICLTHYPQIS